MLRLLRIITAERPTTRRPTRAAARPASQATTRTSTALATRQQAALASSALAQPLLTRAFSSSSLHPSFLASRARSALERGVQAIINTSTYSRQPSRFLGRPSTNFIQRFLSSTSYAQPHDAAFLERFKQTYSEKYPETPLRRATLGRGFELAGLNMTSPSLMDTVRVFPLNKSLSEAEIKLLNTEVSLLDRAVHRMTVKADTDCYFDPVKQEYYIHQSCLDVHEVLAPINIHVHQPEFLSEFADLYLRTHPESKLKEVTLDRDTPLFGLDVTYDSIMSTCPVMKAEALENPATAYRIGKEMVLGMGQPVRVTLVRDTTCLYDETTGEYFIHDSRLNYYVKERYKLPVRVDVDYANSKDFLQQFEEQYRFRELPNAIELTTLDKGTEFIGVNVVDNPLLNTMPLFKAEHVQQNPALKAMLEKEAKARRGALYRFTLNDKTTCFADSAGKHYLHKLHVTINGMLHKPEAKFPPVSFVYRSFG